MKSPELGFRPGNVFWGSKQQRLAHRRHLRNVTVGNETLNITQWAERLGIHRITLAERLRRHAESVAVTVPKLPRGGSHIQKTARKKRPRVHVGVFDREASVTPDMETESLLRLLSECLGDTELIYHFVKETFSEAAAERAIAILQSK